MAESISELLDENQKAAEVLLQRVQEGREAIQHVNNDFVQPLKFQVLDGSGKHVHEELQEFKKNLTEWEHDLGEHFTHYKDEMHELKEKLDALSERVQAIYGEMNEQWDALHKSLENMNSIHTEKEDEEDEKHNSIFDIWRGHMDSLSDKHQKSSSLFGQFHETVDTAQNDFDDLKSQHGGAIEQLGQGMTEHYEELQKAFQQLVELHEEQHSASESILAEARRILEDEAKEKFTEHLPEKISSSADGLLGKLGEFMESASHGHESLGGSIQEIVHKIEEANQTIAGLKPIYGEIESIS